MGAAEPKHTPQADPIEQTERLRLLTVLLDMRDEIRGAKEAFAAGICKDYESKIAVLARSLNFRAPPVSRRWISHGHTEERPVEIILASPEKDCWSFRFEWTISEGLTEIAFLPSSAKFDNFFGIHLNDYPDAERRPLHRMTSKELRAFYKRLMSVIKSWIVHLWRQVEPLQSPRIVWADQEPTSQAILLKLSASGSSLHDVDLVVGIQQSRGTVRKFRKLLIDRGLIELCGKRGGHRLTDEGRRVIESA
jgi:hypothetical protein